MKKFLVLPLLLFSFSTLADSAVLKEIMGEAVYEKSGIGDLTDDQIKVLETWILNNAVEKHVVESSKPKAPASSKQSAPAQPDEAELVVNEPREVAAPPSQPAPAEEMAEEESAPRYVRLAEPEEQPKPPEEEPVTQKYVLVDTLEEGDRIRVKPDLIRSRIDGPFRGWKDNRTRFRLENGEIWEQRQSSTYRTSLDSPEVIIRKGRFGYSMEVPAIGRSVLVKRIR